MKERPILFSGPMVRAILDGRKTQTRRLLNPQPVLDKTPNRMTGPGDRGWVLNDNGKAWRYDALRDGQQVPQCGPYPCKFGQPGDRLRVREDAWMWCEKVPNGTTPKGRPKFKYIPLRVAPVWYCASHPEKPCIDIVHPDTGNAWGWRKKLGRFLPSWASRITLEIEHVRVERLNDISEEDAKAEGVERWVKDGGTVWNAHETENCPTIAKLAYRSLWESINGAGSWAANPWVWVVEFKRI